SEDRRAPRLDDQLAVHALVPAWLERLEKRRIGIDEGPAARANDVAPKHEGLEITGPAELGVRWKLRNRVEVVLLLELEEPLQVRARRRDHWRAVVRQELQVAPSDDAARHGARDLTVSATEAERLVHAAMLVGEYLDDVHRLRRNLVAESFGG